MKNKNMRNFLLIGLYFVLSLKEVLTESENEIKRGVYPFMAVLYYPDEIVEPTGTRFIRGAVLIKPEWLVSSSLETNDTQLEFPRKTLIARVGAISVDANFTFNEDEDEQEREIIQIVRPTNFSASPWWYNDITLLKSLLPFNMTNAVSWTSLSVKRDYMDKTCYILVFAKKYLNSSDEKFLMQFPVELSPPSIQNCGEHFRNETMTCASDIDENKISFFDPDFCLSNAGGPLMCDGGIIGLQTYIDRSCKQPYLYQLLSVWDDFILCGVDEKCQLPECANICEAIDKDVFITSPTQKEDFTILTTKATQETIMEQQSEDSSDEEHENNKQSLSDATQEKVTTIITEDPTTPTTLSQSEVTSPTDLPELTPVAITEIEERPSKASWPKEKFVEHRKKLDEADDSAKMERNTNVEAQRHEVRKKGRNAVGSPNKGLMDLFYSLSIGLLFVTYII